MLSAVAVRKAALAQSTALGDPGPSSTAAKPAPVALSASAKPPSKKRKPAAQPVHSTSSVERNRKKKKTRAPKVAENARSFELPRVARDVYAFAEHDSVDDDEEERMEETDGMEEGDEEEGTFLANFAPSSFSAPSPRVLSTQARSPGRPFLDSSDEEDDRPRFPIITSTVPQLRPGDSASLSTFAPIPGRNQFALSEDELVSLLHRPLAASGHPAPGCALILCPHETICILGTYNLALLCGSSSLAGTPLIPSRTIHRVFAPRSAPLPILRCEPIPTALNRENDPPDGSIPTRIQEVLNAGDALVVIQELHTNVENLGKICRTFEGVFRPPRWGAGASNLGLSGIYMIPRQTADLQPFLLPPTWDTTLSAIVPPLPSADFPELSNGDPPIYLVRGPKKTGKSTFARTLLNRLLTKYARVAFLECDIGQSECTPGGMLALTVHTSPIFGPPFTHPMLPYSAHFVGSSTPRSAPSRYLAAVGALLDTYALDVARCAGLDLDSPLDGESGMHDDARIQHAIPLVVNTMGWSKGLGADLNAQLAALARPTAVFALAPPPPADAGWPARVPDALPAGAHDAPVHTLESAANAALGAHYTPADHRALNILSHLHAVFPASPGPADGRVRAPRNVAATHWDCTPLCACAPYEVAWARAFDALVLDAPGAEDVVPGEVARVLNGALVALVEAEPGAVADGDAGDAAARNEAWRYTQGALPPPPALSRYLGLGLVRGVAGGDGDGEAWAQLLTALPPAALARARVVVKGELELPVWGMLDSGEGSGGPAKGRDGVPFLRWAGGREDGVRGGEKRRVRRNLMRKGQM